VLVVPLGVKKTALNMSCAVIGYPRGQDGRNPAISGLPALSRKPEEFVPFAM